MDAKAKKKALHRAKVNALKQNKRIDSPLVRYNEHDQPVCRICDIALKSDSLWPAHQASRKHHEAVANLKANAATASQTSNVKVEPTKSTPEISQILNNDEPELVKSRPSSTLPPDFFDNQDSKKQKIGNLDSEKKVEEEEPSKSSDMPPPKDKIVNSEAKQIKGALPEGFFDDKDKDLLARGITIVKPDVKDEYKEFEKLIQEDLKEVDDRLEEEEIDAAETIEESETVEQRGYRERVEMLRRKKMELKAAKISANVQGKGVGVTVKESKEKEEEEESSSDEDSDENLTVDWRAKHI